MPPLPSKPVSHMRGLLSNGRKQLEHTAIRAVAELIQDALHAMLDGISGSLSDTLCNLVDLKQEHQSRLQIVCSPQLKKGTAGQQQQTTVSIHRTCFRSLSRSIAMLR